MSNFPFVSDSILRSNLDLSFDHIVDLLTLSESDQYKGKQLLISSLRKTIIIHTASIIEALLLWKLKQISGSGKIQLPNEWKYREIKVLYAIDSSEEVIAGIRKREEMSIDRIDFVKITSLCEKHGIITEEKQKNVDKVREFRNRLHLGGLSEMEKEYKKEDLEFCFKVASQVKEAVSK